MVVLLAPILIVGLVVVSFGLFFKSVLNAKPKYVAIAIVTLSLAYFLNFRNEFYAYNSKIEGSGEIRILAYNLNGDSGHLSSSDFVRELLSFIDSVNADVIAMQEYDLKWNVTLNEELNKRYPYNSDFLIPQWGGYKALYSRFPVRNVICAPREIAPHVVFTEINVNGRWIRFVNVHLASNHYTVNLKDEDAAFADYFSSVKEGYEKRELQSKLIVDSLSKHKYGLPIIIAGDFNDVGGSYTLRILESFGLQDAWWSGGTGIGITYDAHLLKLRLDHILYSKEFELKSVAVPHVKFSDHYPVVADFVLR